MPRLNPGPLSSRAGRSVDSHLCSASSEKSGRLGVFRACVLMDMVHGSSPKREDMSAEVLVSKNFNIPELQ